MDRWLKRQVVWVGLSLALLAPSAWLAFSWRALPHLGLYHDDGLYLVGAKSLAEGRGYRILSLPQQPLQTKYPPLLPALLTTVWKLAPFPANLPFAVALVWCLFPLWLWCVWRTLGEFDLGGAARGVLLAAAALNPLAVLFSFTLMPELLCSTLLLGSLLLSGGPRARPVAAGILAGLAYLAKSAALPLLLSTPLCFLLRRRRREAALFFLTALPFVAAWQYWVNSNVVHSSDLLTLYYTDYTGFQFYNVPLGDLPLVVWHNLDAFLMSIGKLLTFDAATFDSRHVERVVAVAAIAGVVRLIRRRLLGWPLARRMLLIDYVLFALAFSAMLLVWHYQPDQRFLFPLFPLLAAGLWTELTNLGTTIGSAFRKPAWADRIAAGVMAAVVAAFVVYTAGGSLRGVFVFLPRLMGAYAADLEARRDAYTWLARNTPPGAKVFAYDDPLVYLYTGRRAANLPVPTRFFYHGDQKAIDGLLDHAGIFADQHGLDYFLLTPGDFYRDLHEPGARRLAEAIESTEGMRRVFDTPATAIYTKTNAPTLLPLHYSPHASRTGGQETDHP